MKLFLFSYAFVYAHVTPVHTSVFLIFLTLMLVLRLMSKCEPALKLPMFRGEGIYSYILIRLEIYSYDITNTHFNKKTKPFLISFRAILGQKFRTLGWNIDKLNFRLQNTIKQISFTVPSRFYRYPNRQGKTNQSVLN